MPADSFQLCFAAKTESVTNNQEGPAQDTGHAAGAEEKVTALARAGVAIPAILAITTEEVVMIRAIVLAICCSFAMVSSVHAEEQIRVENNSGRDICEFYISAHAENDWGDDLFANLDRCIHHGEYAEVTWSETANEDLVYDVRYVFRNGEDSVFENQVLRSGRVIVFVFGR